MLPKMQFLLIPLFGFWFIVICVAQDLTEMQKQFDMQKQFQNQKNNEKLYVLNKTKEKDKLDGFAFKVNGATQNLTIADAAVQSAEKPFKLALNPIEDKKVAEIKIDEEKKVQQYPFGAVNVEQSQVIVKNISQNPIGEEKNTPQYLFRVTNIEQIPNNGENAASNPVEGKVQGVQILLVAQNSHPFPIRENKAALNPVQDGESDQNKELTTKNTEDNKDLVGSNPIQEKKDVQIMENAKVECPLTTVDCLCNADSEKEGVIQVTLKTIAVVDEKTGNSKCFADENPLLVCERHKCVIVPNKNFEILFQKGKKVYSINYEDDEKEQDSPSLNQENKSQADGAGPGVLDALLSSFFPVEYTYPRVLDESHARVARSVYGSNMCRVPTLANSEVTCWKWPNWQTCKQVCIYGHGLEKGGKTIREKSFTCRNTENKWKPHPIRDCEPFMNCKVHLKSPGDLNCVEPTDGPAYCDINCADYDDYHSHGKVTWKCEEKAMRKGKNRLPHCAAFEESVVRLNPPDY